MILHIIFFLRKKTPVATQLNSCLANHVAHRNVNNEQRTENKVFAGYPPDPQIYSPLPDGFRPCRHIDKLVSI